MKASACEGHSWTSPLGECGLGWGLLQGGGVGQGLLSLVRKPRFGELHLLNAGLLGPSVRVSV
jgi:hypothetical protein